METENYKSLEAKPLFDSQNRIESLFDRLSGVIKKNKNPDGSVKEEHWSDDQQQEWEELRAEIETSKENIQVIYNPDGTIYDKARSKRTNSFWKRIQLINLGIDHKTALADSEGIEHHVSRKTLIKMVKFNKSIKR